MLYIKFEFPPFGRAAVRFLPRAGIVAASVILVGKPDLLRAHGFAGDRFFPATILTDDPFVADEMSLPTFTRPPTAADGTHEFDLDVDIAKRILPNLGSPPVTGGSALTRLACRRSAASTG